ncbi:hypothetical protein HMPREF0201_03707 [Cedecea davisae DSM 4568]|uniref:Uncharacterized protein n=1 Tax=Cedecea davisae DSM 4568 TaxID=566551 RepID=S3JP75_9ENTR|nr:hypothetical protein HMPREF0201_03707 [Cedecea davisae DSM 4568]
MPGFYPHYAAQGMQQLRAAVTVPWLRLTMKVIMGKRNQRPRGEIKFQAGGHSLLRVQKDEDSIRQA